MGGFLSGKGVRPTRMHRRKRCYVFEVPSIHIRKCDTRAFDATAEIPQLIIGNENFRFQISLNRRVLPRGGIWYTFRCPSCGTGRFKLYFFRTSLACHKCHRLAYRIENHGKADRANDMKWKYVHQISEESFDSPSRPSGMHRRTYDRIMAKVEEYDDLAWNRFFGADFSPQQRMQFMGNLLNR